MKLRDIRKINKSKLETNPYEPTAHIEPWYSPPPGWEGTTKEWFNKYQKQYGKPRPPPDVPKPISVYVPPSSPPKKLKPPVTRKGKRIPIFWNPLPPRRPPLTPGEQNLVDTWHHILSLPPDAPRPQIYIPQWVKDYVRKWY